MSVLVLVEASVQPDRIRDFMDYLAAILPDTRAYDGCHSVEVYSHDENPTEVVLAETWDSRSHHEQYVGWRAETGVLTKLLEMLAGAPSTRYFDHTPT